MCQMKCWHISIQTTHYTYLANYNNNYSVLYAWNLENIINIANAVLIKRTKQIR